MRAKRTIPRRSRSAEEEEPKDRVDLLDVLGAEVAGREPASVPEGQGVTALPPGQELLLAPLHRPGEAAEPGRLRPPYLRRRSHRGGGGDADRLLVHAPRHGRRSFSHPDVHLVLAPDSPSARPPRRRSATPM